jgi:hypothetical protein
MRSWIKNYLQSARRRAELLAEARELLAALEQPAATGTIWDVMEVLYRIGVGHLRAVKGMHDAAAAAREMDLRIRQGPRPSYPEAGLN